MRRRHVAGTALAISYAGALGGLLVLFASWGGGPGWHPGTVALFGFVPLALLGAGLARRVSFVGLPLLFLAGMPAQMALFFLAFVNPRILFLPFPDEVAMALTVGVGATILAWFGGFFLLLSRSPAGAEELVVLHEIVRDVGPADPNE